MQLPRQTFRHLLLVVAALAIHLSSADAFLSTRGCIPSVPASHGSSCDGMLRMSDNDDDAKSRLRDLGFSDVEIERSTREPVKEQPKVRVDMVDNVDATTLTAVGFGLVAFNFFVLANMGDGGIGGLVATIINSF